ncbi:beta-Glucocerebrosidase 2 N terminal [Vibrio xiamenensis]|uniref:Beta-Glucocerebrosidase 2 N terminal n=1 Tax=Vibrio xiamenensis TaxID=861298 RepID=A0A1G7YYE1_9VIBR|nr:GH116 family glycosyl hydrolase [Vibrio xiamenensis]SDH01592.1 beta-Glucocerebrosidase 2 N terminal [Vibrio xiamenensis]
MKNTIPYTSYHGLAQALTSSGEAVEFIQPWYTPISTTPANTGMAVGGIGSAFTLTPNGDTPNFSFIPGIFIDVERSDIHFNDFYLSVAKSPSVDSLTATSLSELQAHLKYYPALFNGKPLAAASVEHALQTIKQALKSGEFYQQNQAQFEKWHIEFAPHTQRALTREPKAIATQLLVAMDFFNGIVFCLDVLNRRLTADKSNAIQAVSGCELEYHALYPLAQYDYHGLGDVAVKRKVVSPVVKDQPKWCTMPLHWNEFELTNHSDETRIITLVQPLANLIGSTYRKGRDGVQDSACTLSQNPIAQRHNPVTLESGAQRFDGVFMSSDSPYGGDIEGGVMFGVCADNDELNGGQISVSVKPSIYSSKTEREVENALNTGRVNRHFDAGIYSGREALSAIACVRLELAPQQSLTVRFFQVMDHSKIALNDWRSEKAYTQYFCGENRIQAMLQCALDEYERIEKTIVANQQAFYAQTLAQFSRPDVALKYATMAMNSLSFLAESSVWDRDNQFLVKECVDYPFFNSLDVYFYGSFSLLYLLPSLDGFVMKAFAKAILAEDDTVRRYWEYEDKPFAELVDDKYQGVRAIRGAVVHDLGSPYDIQPDAYSWHNVKEWKDLAPKFVLMVYRHYQRCGDLDVVKECWSAVKESIAFLEAMIEPGEHFPLTRGTDDTFDNLSSHGISIYCGSLWVAGLRIAAKLADLMSECELASHYQFRAEQALAELEATLWHEQNGYYHFFATPIQAQHLTGEGVGELNSLGLALGEDNQTNVRLLNAWLNRAPELGEPAQMLRKARKQQLFECAPKAFNPSYEAIIELDSDNSFGDALLADSYLQLLGEPGLFRPERVERSLEYVYQHNFVINSPKLGIANMVLANGAPHEAFQAQDVWIGVQFSAATALKLANKSEKAERLIDTLYEALYTSAKIPFAAPEGFNSSVVVTEQAMCAGLDITPQQAKIWLSCFKRSQLVLEDGRVNPEFEHHFAKFFALLEQSLDQSSVKRLQRFLANTGLKYTAGRYFRPGMVFAFMGGAKK